jgi:hypothetical protein
MHEELVLIHRELYQVCKYDEDFWDPQSLGVVSYIPPLPGHHVKNAFLTSSCLKLQPLETATVKTSLIAVALTTGLKASS